MQNDAGKIVTVTGTIDPEELGVTLPHEHLFSNWEEKFEEPDSELFRELAREPITLENLWYVRRHPTKHIENLRLDSVEDSIYETEQFVESGGNTVVDVTPKNTGMDPIHARTVSRETGANVIKGTSFYYYDAHPDRVLRMSIREIADEFVSDIHEGIDGTDIRAGIIGEIGLSTDSVNGQNNPAGIYEDEEKVLRAGIRAALRTGAAISIHPPGERNSEYPPSVRTHEVLDICKEEGLSADRVIMGHMDQSRWVDSDIESQKELADRGALLEYDLFGHERYMFEDNDGQPSDWDRVDSVSTLVEEGYQNKLLMSHDIYLKHWLKRYGGNGWSHILETIIPVLQDRGVPETAINDIMVDNPRRVLTFENPTT